MIDNIFELYENHCLSKTKDAIIMAIANDGRLTKANTYSSARQYYIYNKNINEQEAIVILSIVQNALVNQNTVVSEAIESTNS